MNAEERIQLTLKLCEFLKINTVALSIGGLHIHD